MESIQTKSALPVMKHATIVKTEQSTARLAQLLLSELKMESVQQIAHSAMRLFLSIRMEFVYRTN